MPELYFVDREADPGIIFMIEDGRYRPVYFRRSGQVDAIGICETGPAYFVAANQNDIYLTDGLTETLVYRHHNYVRNICFHPDSGDYLYFSESWGAGRDGQIFRLNLRLEVAENFCTVPVSEVGAWAGDFAFDPDGNLYISSGNRIPASIYRYDLEHFVEQYTTEEPIMGFCFVDMHTLYYANQRNHICRLTDFADRVIEFEARADARLTDVVYVELRDSSFCNITGRLYGGETFWPRTTISCRGPDLFWRLNSHASTHADEQGNYELENLFPGSYWVLTEIATDGWAAFLPDHQFATCGCTGVDFTMSREGLSLDLIGLECNDAQEITDEVFIIVNGDRIWSSHMKTGHHRPVGRTFTFHEDINIEVWEEDRWRDDRIGVFLLPYEDAVALMGADEGPPYTHTFHRDRGIIGDATYTLHFDIV